MLSSRKITDLSPRAQEAFAKFYLTVERSCGLIYRVHWGVSRTLCDQEYQDWLYAQGRTRPGPIVTWTRHSDHLTGNAWDVYVFKDGVALWSIEKADVNQDGEPDYIEMAKVGRELDLDVGGYWVGKKDWPHYAVRVG
jgi:peptidoglycan LD-endopeptidase CwlK